MADIDALPLADGIMLDRRFPSGILVSVVLRAEPSFKEVTYRRWISSISTGIKAPFRLEIEVHVGFTPLAPGLLNPTLWVQWGVHG